MNWKRLFPAYAGVIHSLDLPVVDIFAFPRIRGGDPPEKRVIEISYSFSPHTRGGIPISADQRRKIFAFPRICGGDPYFTMLWTAYRDFSPHTRG